MRSLGAKFMSHCAIGVSCFALSRALKGQTWAELTSESKQCAGQIASTHGGVDSSTP